MHEFARLRPTIRRGRNMHAMCASATYVFFFFSKRKDYHLAMFFSVFLCVVLDATACGSKVLKPFGVNSYKFYDSSCKRLCTIIYTPSPVYVLSGNKGENYGMCL
jgi:hypothetical protein